VPKEDPHNLWVRVGRQHPVACEGRKAGNSVHPGWQGLGAGHRVT
jgi:hypothetical protein